MSYRLQRSRGWSTPLNPLAAVPLFVAAGWVFAGRWNWCTVSRPTTALIGNDTGTDGARLFAMNVTLPIWYRPIVIANRRSSCAIVPDAVT